MELQKIIRKFCGWASVMLYITTYALWLPHVPSMERLPLVHNRKSHLDYHIIGGNNYAHSHSYV